jgi:hypothetical protein
VPYRQHVHAPGAAGLVGWTGISLRQRIAALRLILQVTLQLLCNLRHQLVQLDQQSLIEYVTAGLAISLLATALMRWTRSPCSVIGDPPPLSGRTLPEGGTHHIRGSRDAYASDRRWRVSSRFVV